MYLRSKSVPIEIFVYSDPFHAILLAMKPFKILSNLGLLEGKTALDIGARDCSIALTLADNGFLVDAIDILDCPEKCQAPKIHYTKVPFEDFKPSKKYDLVVARHVIPFLSSSIESSLDKVFGLINDKGVFFFTLFGEKDGWANSPKVKVTSIDYVRETVANRGRIVYETEQHYEGKTYAGNIKKWHVITMVVVTT